MLEYKPRIVCVYDPVKAREMEKWARVSARKTRVVCGLSGLNEVAGKVKADLLLSAVVGSIGLEPLINAIRSGKNIALANKEALVVAGEIIMSEAKKNGVDIVPVDSEHSAIFQCLKDEDKISVTKIILTASGGPFYRYKKSHESITVEQALDHPTWDMGPKITIDSATLMNKGLEAIEAHHLFSVGMDRIDIVIHPQSIVHSMVEFVDTTVLAHMSIPNMELPIQYAITYPGRVSMPIKRLDLAKAGRLDFDSPDFKRFPCLKLALEAGNKGGSMPVVMNAANETAVDMFLNNKIKFTDIPKIVSKAMRSHRVVPKPSLSRIMELDSETRNRSFVYD